METRFFRQENKNTCGIAVLRTDLWDNFKIKESEKSLVNLAEDLYKRMYKEKYGCAPTNDEYKIYSHGTARISHFINIGRYFELNTFLTSRGNLDDLKKVMDMGFWPIIHRPFEEDGDGHYILTYHYNHSMYIFNPANGREYGRKRESYSLFDRKWRFPRINEKWFLCLFPKDVEIPIKDKGRIYKLK